MVGILGAATRGLSTAGEPRANGDSFTEGLLARDESIVMEPGQENLLRFEVLECALDQAVHEGMPPEQLRPLRELAPGDMMEVFRWSLTGDSPTKVTPMRVK